MILITIIVILTVSIVWILLKTNLLSWFCATMVMRAARYMRLQRPKRVILIRHGESGANNDPNLYSTTPDHAIPLTEKGREQARLCGKEISSLIGSDETITCFMSPFRRSKETCELICEAFAKKQILKVKEDPRIRELEWGNFQDAASRDETATERQKVGRFFYRFRTGESGADVYDRISIFMDSLFREMKDKLLPKNNILIVSHGLFMRLFLMRYYRWSVEKFETLDNFKNCGYCIMERSDEDGSYVLKTQLKTYS